MKLYKLIYFTFRIFILHFSQQLRHKLRKPLQKLEKHQKLQELFLLLTCYPRVTVPSFSITNDNSAFWKEALGKASADSYLIRCSTRQASADSFLITPRPCDVKRHCTGLFLGLIQKKKWLRPSACLQVQRLTGVIFIIHCSYLVIPKLYFIEREVNSIQGKSIQSLNDAIFKNYLKEARWGFPMR